MASDIAAAALLLPSVVEDSDVDLARLPLHTRHCRRCRAPSLAQPRGRAPASFRFRESARLPGPIFDFRVDSSPSPSTSTSSSTWSPWLSSSTPSPDCAVPTLSPDFVFDSSPLLLPTTHPHLPSRAGFVDITSPHPCPRRLLPTPRLPRPPTTRPCAPLPSLDLKSWSYSRPCVLPHLHLLRLWLPLLAFVVKLEFVFHFVSSVFTVDFESRFRFLSTSTSPPTPQLSSSPPPLRPPPPALASPPTSRSCAPSPSLDLAVQGRLIDSKSGA
ncbi:hypothetical protein C8R45DRAFT_1095413 [Mycena sanguinolenta]|nr:hypothetical protein C8R45DRAFT_1095413 [Mycena sanguinolenta]